VPPAEVEVQDHPGNDPAAEAVQNAPDQALEELEALRIPAEAIGDLPQEIEDQAGEGMSFFHRRLLAVARREPAALARVLIYSDSLNGTDWVGSSLRRSLAERFGDGGKGFLPITPGWDSQDHLDLSWTHRMWRTAVVNRGLAPLGRYGLGGVLASNGGRLSRAVFATREQGPVNSEVSLLALLYQAWPEGGEVLFQVDDEPPEGIDTASTEVEDRVFRRRVTEGPHRLTVSVGRGDLRLYGAVMERDGPGVVVDSVMWIGATVAAPRNFDSDHLEGQVRARSPDLVIFWIGANDVRSRNFSHDEFVASYGQFISTVRAGRPEASCLVMFEPDQGKEQDGRILSRHFAAAMVEAQRATARAQGCATFDLYELAGGQGSVERWARAHPRLLAGDLLHLTYAGATHVADLLHRALLEDYDDSLEELIRGSETDD
jgi:hypothetical protein